MAINHEEIQIQWKLLHIYSRSSSILKAIEYIVSEINLIHITIHSDSLKYTHQPTKSSQSLWYHQENPERPLHCKIFQQKHISYSWISSHCKIEGNERADKAAKLFQSPPGAHISSLFSYSDFKKYYQNGYTPSMGEQMAQNEYQFQRNKKNNIMSLDLPHQYRT